MLEAMWRPGMEGLYRGANAQMVADEIMSIGESATPEQIVEKARDETAELHKCFEWDDTKAAQRWRLHEARVLTSNLIVKESDVTTEEPRTPIRFLVKTDSSSGYKPIERVHRNVDEYQMLLNQAYSELRAFQRKYSRLSELDDIFALIP